MKTKSFADLGLHTDLLQNITKQGLNKPYPIQEKAIPVILNRKDMLGIAKTGSGKTAAYVWPILQRLIGNPETTNRAVNTLVVVPTRELAIQVSEVFKTYSIGLPHRIKTLAVYGGVSINPQMKALQNVNVLVATPGRLLELLDSNALTISEITTFVLDEADKMLNQGFKEEMDRIFKKLPGMRQTLLFSATLNESVDNIKTHLLYQPEVIKIEEEKADDLSLIKQSAYFIPDNEKGRLLRYLINEKKMEQVLIFASSIQQVDRIVMKLNKNGFSAEGIHSKISQGGRQEILQEFKSGIVKILVTTDLLARGIDIAYLPFVINYELPRSPKDFIHRIGRTGRAEKKGQALTFVSPDEEHHFKIIQKKMGKWIDRVNIEDCDY